MTNEEKELSRKILNLQAEVMNLRTEVSCMRGTMTAMMDMNLEISKSMYLLAESIRCTRPSEVN